MDDYRTAYASESYSKSELLDMADSFLRDYVAKSSAELANGRRLQLSYAEENILDNIMWAVSTADKEKDVIELSPELYEQAYLCRWMGQMPDSFDKIDEATLSSIYMMEQIRAQNKGSSFPPFIDFSKIEYGYRMSYKEDECKNDTIDYSNQIHVDSYKDCLEIYASSSNNMLLHTYINTMSEDDLLEYNQLLQLCEMQQSADGQAEIAQEIYDKYHITLDGYTFDETTKQRRAIESYLAGADYILQSSSERKCYEEVVAYMVKEYRDSLNETFANVHEPDYTSLEQLREDERYYFIHGEVPNGRPDFTKNGMPSYLECRDKLNEMCASFESKVRSELDYYILNFEDANENFGKMMDDYVCDIENKSQMTADELMMERMVRSMNHVREMEMTQMNRVTSPKKNRRLPCYGRFSSRNESKENDMEFGE